MPKVEPVVRTWDRHHATREKLGAATSGLGGLDLKSLGLGGLDGLLG